MAIDSEESSPEDNLPPDPGADPLLSAVVDGKYQITGVIGDGGMGRVYRAEQPSIGRTVALKMLHRHLVENEKLLTRFHNEARVASKLRHPNIALVYDYGVWEGRPYIAMELVPGKTLREEIAAHGSFDEDAVRDIALQITAALQEAHSLGIVHRDLKPDNIICQREEGRLTIRVLDFGIAKILEAEEGERITRTGTFFGTPRYSSPEQGLGKPLDARSDLYSLGVVLYEAITGEVPFDSPSSLELLMLHVNAPLIAPRERRRGLALSRDLERVITRLLEKKPDARFQSAAELQHVLQDRSPNAGDESEISLRHAAVGLSVLALTAIGLYHLVSRAFLTHEDARTLPPPAITEPPVASPSAPFPPEERFPVTNPEQEVAPEPVDTLDASVFEPSAIASPPMPPQEAVEPSGNPHEIGPAAVPRIEPSFAPATPESGTAWDLFKPRADASPVPLPRLSPTPLGDQTSQPSVNPEADFQQGYAFYVNRQYLEAIPLLRAAEVGLTGQKRVAALVALSICEQRTGQTASALQSLDRARDLAPDNAIVQFHLACLFATMGRKDDAFTALGAAIKIDRGVAQRARREPELAPLQSDPRFAELTKQPSRGGRQRRQHRSSIEDNTGRTLGTINRAIRDWGIFRR